MIVNFMNQIAKNTDSFMKTWLEFAKTVIIVAVLPWSVWMTDSMYKMKAFAEKGERFTLTDAALLEERVYVRVMEGVPPDWLREDVKKIQEDIVKIREDQAMIKAKLK